MYNNSNESAVETSDIGIMVIPYGKYAMSHFEIFKDEYKGHKDFYTVSGFK